ncbi:MAG: hypothetical protein R6U00_03555 [Prochlorococcaceae cyanobacterium]
MGPFTLCVAPPLGASTAAAAAALHRWQSLGMPLLPYGEWGLGEPQGQPLLADLRTTAADQPRLDDLLRLLHNRARSHALVLICAEAEPTPAWCDALAELALRRPPVLAFGRAWRGGAQLDAPFSPSWVLLPRGPWQPPLHQAETLAADPAAALPWLLQLAGQQGWTALEATDAAPLQATLPTPLPGPTTTAPQAELAVHPVQRLASTAAGSVGLSLLLPPAVEAAAWRQALHPAASLPWEVLEAPLQHWRQARGELIWPLPAGSQPPPLALLPVLLRALRNPWIDGVSLPEAPALLRRGVVERLGVEAFDPGHGRACGLRLLPLPLRLPSSAMSTPESPSGPDPLWQAAERQLARAETLLLAQQRRIAELEAQLKSQQTADPEDG